MCILHLQRTSVNEVTRLNTQVQENNDIPVSNLQNSENSCRKLLHKSGEVVLVQYYSGLKEISNTKESYCTIPSLYF